MNATVNKNLMSEFREYIDKVEYGMPIVIADVVFGLNKRQGVNINRNTVSKYLNRMVLNGEVKRFDDGIFYRTKKNKFGEIKMDYQELVKDIYLFDVKEKNVIGYRVGAVVFNEMGITDNMENRITIVTNNRVKRKFLNKTNLNIDLKRPVSEINNENYLYFQLLDTVELIDVYHWNKLGAGKKFVNYLASKGMELDKLFGYAKKYYSKNVMIMLSEILAS